MSLKRRLLVLTAILAVALVVQFGLSWHMRSGAASLYPDMRNDVSALPLVLPPGAEPKRWIGKESGQLDAIRKQLPFTPDDLVSRYYRLADAPLVVNLYLVHSRQADDRKHHPEICIRDVTGAPEDMAARGLVFLDAEQKRAVQRFRFRTGSSQYTTVYYWHYTFAPLPQEGESFLQALYQRMNTPAPSVTAQVSTVAELDQLGPVEKTFLVALDQALQKDCLPAGTFIGCDRLPIALIRR